MKKLSVYVLFVLLAIVAAGLYGIIHNQFSYTVSPEYFTKFKFRQFGYVDSQLPERVRASMIGFLASWWMGIPIGLLIGIAGFIHRGYRRMFKILIQAMGVAIAFTVLFGICGLLYGFIQTTNLNPADYSDWFVPSDVINLRRFLCAGYMHNSAYLGGVLSIFVALGYQVVVNGKVNDLE